MLYRAENEEGGILCIHVKKDKRELSGTILESELRRGISGR